MGTISDLFKRDTWRAKFEHEREKRRRLEVAAAYREAREQALLDLVEDEGLEDEAAVALTEAASDGYAESLKVKRRHTRERS